MADPAKCSKCGNISGFDTRNVTCEAKTCWQPGNTDTGVVDTMSVPAWVIDDKKEWSIPLCEECKVDGYKYHLKEMITMAKNALHTSLGILVVAILIRLWAASGNPGTLLRFMLGLLSVLIVTSIVVAIVGVIGGPVCRSKLRKAEDTGEVPPEEINNAFDGEACRILKSLEADTKDFHGDYPLPVFNTIPSRKGIVIADSLRKITNVTKVN